MSEHASDAEDPAHEAWQQRNDEYLAVSLRWLRLRLLRLAAAHRRDAEPPPPEPASPPTTTVLAVPATSVAVPAPGRRRRFGRRPDAPAVPLPPIGPTPAIAPPERGPALAAAAPVDVEDELAAAEAARRELEDDPAPPALVVLGARLGLSPFECDVLLLGASVELMPGIGQLCGAAQGDPALSFPTLALALSAFDDPAWEAVSPERPLRAARLLEIGQTTGGALITSPLRADERIVNYLKGLNQLDDRLGPFVVPLAAGSPPPDLPPSQSAVAVGVARRLAAAADAGGPAPVVHLIGSDGVSKRLVAWHAARLLDRHLLRVPAMGLPTAPADLELFVRLWRRETALLPVALYLDAADLPGDPGAAEGTVAATQRLLAGTIGVRFLDAAEGTPAGGGEALTVDVATPSSGEQRGLWSAALGPSSGTWPARLASQFDLNPVAIAGVARATVGLDGNVSDDVWRECLSVTRPRLDTLAHRIPPLAGWDDLVLPPDRVALLRLIVDQVRHRSTVYDDWGVAQRMNRGLGIGALFAGESGTGKTMAAEVVAKELELDLYRIDLSAVVSKYIGETEKNLKRVFDAAETGGAILLFDEADALFGKRSEVKDSHDRYANIEINYLLQRMEAYRGLAILATNRKSALDAAFVRRLRFIVDFPFPAPPEQERIWRRAFAPGVATEGLDFERLASLNLSGGSISNVALDATFAAASTGGTVTMPLVLAAVGRDLRKQGRPVKEADLRWAPAGAAR